ncbi:MAG TPA: hypothetical protein EYG89_00580, partial [Bacteroidia bacterium]|nr:hypothetical protein [Bacteroidia bacterium]
MRDMTIINKLQSIFFIILLFFIAYIIVSYQFTNNARKDLKDISSIKSIKASIHKENYQLLTKMKFIVYDAHVSLDIEILKQLTEPKKKILNNLEEIWQHNPLHREQQLLLNQYYNIVIEKITKTIHEAESESLEKDMTDQNYQIMETARDKLFSLYE